MVQQSGVGETVPLLEDLPDPALLHWLVHGGSLRQNLSRAIRLWVWLRSLYGDESERLCLEEPFTYKDWRDTFFLATHPKGEAIPDRHDPTCACAKTASEWLFTPQMGLSELEWRSQIQQHSAIDDAALNNILHSSLFAVTRRSLASDLAALYKLGWLQGRENGYYRVTEFPSRPGNRGLDLTENALGGYDLGFLNAHLESIAQQLSQPIAEEQRFFLEVDYIIAQTQQRVEAWLEELKSVWEEAIVPPVRLTYSSAKYGVMECMVYPVCVYYVQRAIYLCALGETPDRKGDWYNYRLDKMQKIVRCQWDDPRLPLILKQRRKTLPSPYYIRREMEQAWGFDFYLKPRLMLLRFKREFHDRYIQGTFRHKTFQRISYERAKQIIHDAAAHPSLIKMIQSRSPEDAYYTVRYRDGDTNVGQRLRSWRPKVEVLLPWDLREKMQAEMQAEIELYQD
ncbi:TIGR03985 family CRISPR-associated protein [Leptolyngbya sp. GB1-A1]|uniref:TIGR03985 family CRISPR-associated protein n=1 Tax=Leptolyngbya sp. GB1-A1 TaxID=2933908 RepID=UPI003296959E